MLFEEWNCWQCSQWGSYLSIGQNDRCVEDDSDIDTGTREDDDSDNSADDEMSTSLDDSLQQDDG